MMKKSLLKMGVGSLSILAAALVLVPTASAQEASSVTAAASESSVNIGLTTDYRYRGISQTRLKPALQGGADWSQPATGLYAGAWLSTIQWIKDTPGAGSTPIEADIYAGKKGQLNKDFSYDVGVLGYVYLNNQLDKAGLKDANTLELYGQLNFGPAYLKYSHAVTPLFGIVDSKNSAYVDAGANLEVAPTYTLNLHVGYQKVSGINDSAATYTDYKLGLSKELQPGLVLSGALVGTNADRAFYASPVNGKFMGKRALVVSLVKTFN